MPTIFPIVIMYEKWNHYKKVLKKFLTQFQIPVYFLEKNMGKKMQEKEEKSEEGENKENNEEKDDSFIENGGDDEGGDEEGGNEEGGDEEGDDDMESELRKFFRPLKKQMFIDGKEETVLILPQVKTALPGKDIILNQKKQKINLIKHDGIGDTGEMTTLMVEFPVALTTGIKKMSDSLRVGIIIPTASTDELPDFV